MSDKTVKTDSDIGMGDAAPMNDAETESRPTQRHWRRWLIISLDIFLILVLLATGLFGYAYFNSPETIRNPKLEHYHFRMQVVVNGAVEDFSTEGYQTGYAKDQCNANLPEQPIHFHDNKDQFTHIHWEGMTGGMVMKYYGWNFIGGINNALGYKLNDFGDIQKVTTHGNYLPKLASSDQLYVYTGDETGYTERSFDDWKDQDLEAFFNVTSNFPAHELNKQSSGVLDQILPTAYAQGEDVGNDIETEAEELTRINNLIGNVVIFAQSEKPNDEQVRARFNDLEPLSDSTCGG